MKIQQTASPRVRLLCLLLAVVMLLCAAAILPGVSMEASAAGTPTSFGLAEHGMKAYRDGWVYQSAGKGQTVNGVRVSDCAGLIYAYFSDVGVSGCMGGATSQVTYNCAFSGNIPDGIPRIHGLVLTVPDYNDPGGGVYGHIGIYVGNGEVVDNSSYGVNMRWQKVANNSSWTAWHIFDNGTRYPSNGWYTMDGKMYHYTNYQYDVSTTVDGYIIGSDGVALGADGGNLPVTSSLTNDGYVSASTVASYLSSLGYSGNDNTYELAFGLPIDPGDDLTYNGRITGSGVRVRSQPNTSSSILTTLSLGARVKIVETVDGQSLTLEGVTSADWIAVMTPAGHSGYVWSGYVEKISIPGSLTAPVIASDGAYVSITTDDEDAEIFYTTDGTTPTGDSTPYTGPVYLVGCTYKAIAVKDSAESSVSTASVMSNGSVFTDFTVSNWFFSVVDEALTYGIFNGNDDNTFAPNQSISRGQFVRALANLDGVDLTAYNSRTTFGDVPTGRYYTGAVAWAVEAGIVNGFEDNTFRPNAVITREQMCQMISAYAGLAPEENPTLFADDSDISRWAKDAVYACRNAGIINGVGSNRFNPKGTATRAQACVVTVNCYTL